MPKTSERPVVLVTGGGTGVGAAAVIQLAKRGYNAVVNYSRSRAEAEATAGVAAGHGADAIALQGNVAENADCCRIVEATVERFGRLDAVVNSAGATQFVPIHELGKQNAEDFQRVYGVNVIGTYQMVRAAAPYLKQSGSGAIVNISSIAGTNGNGSSIAYVASKGALNTLTLTLARLLSPEVRVNCVLPGLIDTRWLPDGLGVETFETVKRNFASMSALDDVCSAEDIADAVTFLVADALKMTGQFLTVDAGFVLGRPARVSK
ncbi:SDR family NAD(P)-dependent oxidoreductase [Chelatococcus reniformis]|uniref:Oxidoreductase n=1 Tax=Chelatococcus reniformis TaxID=1494448 RepID=A0A916XKT0_9HYPH|nr:SDR family oxidoreductase [Chelatococcus reniformis]GGC82281.1 oxidoreductase [Chelatococcus reniformis]